MSQISGTNHILDAEKCDPSSEDKTINRNKRIIDRDDWIYRQEV